MDRLKFFGLCVLCVAILLLYTVGARFVIGLFPEEEAAQEGLSPPTVVIFTADWCTACPPVEKFWKDPLNLANAEEFGYEVVLCQSWRGNLSDECNALKDKFYDWKYPAGHPKVTSFSVPTAIILHDGVVVDVFKGAASTTKEVINCLLGL